MYCRLFLLLLLSAALKAASYDLIFQKNYSDLPFQTRIENSGVYGIASFFVDGNIVYFKTFDSKDVFVYENGQYRNFYTDKNSSPDISSKPLVNSLDDQAALFRDCYNTSDHVFLACDNSLKNNSGEQISVLVPSRSKLLIELTLKTGKSTQAFDFNNDLAAADLIGIDAAGNEFILIEKYLVEVPLKIKREVWTVSSSGRLLSVLEVPSIKCLATVKDFMIDEYGILYHLLTERSSVTIIKWNGLTAYTEKPIAYPGQYRYTMHYNSFVPVKEAPTEPMVPEKLASSRNTALRLGESYVLYRYNCASANLAPTAVRVSDGDSIKTPARLIVGRNAKIPYKWGGFNTLSSFASGLTSGKYAGDIHTANSSSYAVGVDCSGFVSRCWQLSSHYATSSMPSITNLYASWDSLRPADAVHKVGHVRMFVQKNANGSLKVVESSGRDWGVSYWSYLPSDLTDYSPRAYIGMESNYSINRPELYSALLVGSSGIQLKWQCDTTGVIGYRLYYSKDNSSWLCLMDENTLKTNSVSIASTNETKFYRVSSVVNSGTVTESNWSNVLAAANYNSAKKLLIIDGFYREIGTWRGAGHTFVYNYAKALAAQRLSIESIRGKQSGMVNLRDYAAVYRIVGDQSTLDESLNSAEQDTIKAYLENGGCLFISGSELGWDLYNKGTASDKAFYNNYLKAAFVADDAGIETVTADVNSIFAGLNFQFAQTYEVDFPDAITAYGGSSNALWYNNNKVAGIQFSGTFGASSIPGKLVYIAFPVETTANDTAFNAVITRSIVYFLGLTDYKEETVDKPERFYLARNYPNPFNPSTKITYTIETAGLLTLRIYNTAGQVVETLVNEFAKAGEHEVNWNASGYPSGVYYCQLISGSNKSVRKMILLK